MLIIGVLGLNGPLLLSDIINIRRESVVMTAIHWGLTFWGFTSLKIPFCIASGQIIYVTEIFQSLWFENLSSTYQKGNLHSDPVNPLPALLAFFFVFSSKCWNFSWPDSVVTHRMDRMFFFYLIAVSAHVQRAERHPIGMPQTKHSYIWGECTLIWHWRAKWHGQIV